MFTPAARSGSQSGAVRLVQVLSQACPEPISLNFVEWIKNFHHWLLKKIWKKCNIIKEINLQISNFHKTSLLPGILNPFDNIYQSIPGSLLILRKTLLIIKYYDIFQSIEFFYFFQGTKLDPTNFTKVLVLFVILSLGILISLMVFGLEYCFSYVTKSKEPFEDFLERNIKKCPHCKNDLKNKWIRVTIVFYCTSVNHTLVLQ